jgi:UDP-N-acetylglucosamine acyltransferase
MSQISPLAVIHPQAQIGQEVTIEPFVSVHADVVIGDGCWIGSSAVLYDGTRLGKHCQVFPGAVLSALPQDRKYKGEPTTTEIGDSSVIREYATINRGTSYHNKTAIGSHTLVMAYVHIAHDCIIGNQAIIVNSVNIAGHVEIGDYAVIGGMSAIHQFSKIGAHVMIAGGSMVRKDVPPFITAARNPISYSGVNTTGLRRRGFSPENIQTIQDIYRIIFLQSRNVRRALAQVEQEIPPSDARDAILQFIRQSDRGILRGYQFTHAKDEVATE